MGKAASLLLASALTIVGLALQPVDAAQAKTHRVQTVKADVDGDGRRDSVRVDRIRNSSQYRTTYTVTVNTAKGKKVSRTLTMQGSVESGRITKPLIATLNIDGAKGTEIVLRTVLMQNVAMGNQSSYVILTWRKGKLVKEKPAKGTWLARGFTGEGSGYGSSLVFDQVRGVKYSLTCSESDAEHYDQDGKLYREYSYRLDSSAWRNGKWQPAVTGAVTSVPDGRCEPHRAATLVLTP